MTRRVAAWLMVVVLLTAWSPNPAWAQANPKETGPVVGNGDGTYTQAAGVSLVGALDRASEAVNAFPGDGTPRQVKDSPFRRRLLELRLLMDFHAFAYDKDRLKIYREMVDQAYESVGVFQDITDIEKELGISVSPDVVAQRRAEMTEGMAQFRNSNTRSEIRRFLGAPLSGPRTGGGPGLWDITGTRASNQWDAVGNSAEFQSGILRHLQGSDLGVADIFNPDQAHYFHLVRKQIRDVVILSAMYPAITGATVEQVKALDEMVGDYGDVMEAFNSYTFALQSGMDTEKIAAELRREFEKSQMIKNQFVESHALDAMAIKLNEVRDAHRR